MPEQREQSGPEYCCPGVASNPGPGPPQGTSPKPRSSFVITCTQNLTGAHQPCNGPQKEPDSSGGARTLGLERLLNSPVFLLSVALTPCWGPWAVSGPRLRPAAATCSVENGGPTALGVAPTLQQSGRGPLGAPFCHHHALGMVFRKVSSAIKLGWVLALHLPTVTLRCYFTVLIPGALCARTVRIHTHTHAQGRYRD